jgi:hypothetical protein
LVVRAANAATRHRPRPKTTIAGVIPAPTKGVDARVSLAAGDLSVCPYTYNIMPDEAGMRVRQGYREHVLAVEDATSHGVGTMIPLEGIAGTDDKLFCATNEGIWDVTAYNTAPTKKVAFTADNTANAGFGMHINYVDQSGAQFIYYADNLNGLWFYTVSTDTWAAVTNITGIDETTICGIVVHKLRVWVFARNAASAWYLGINAITGAATEFVFGGKFTRGGYVAGMYNWTLDGGAGVDDYLVIASSAGDALMYQGEDPSASSTWSIVGTYDIGAAPVDYRAGLEYAGELFILTGYGLVSMDEILRGSEAENPETSDLAFKIAKVLQQSMIGLRNIKGWNPIFFPAEGLIILVSPVQTDGTYIQYVLDLTTRGWGYWRGLPILSAGVWQNKLYFGTVDDKIMVMDVHKDNILITPPSAPSPNGNPIEYSILHSSSDMGSPGIMKRGAFIRPNFRADYAPVIDTKILYDYNLAEFSAVLAQPSSSVGIWDTGVWNTATWGSGASTAWGSATGGDGIGRSLAVAIRGSSTAPTVLISTDVMWNTGGML